MKIREVLIGATVAMLAACGTGGMDDYENEEPVPSGAIPAAPDARPGGAPGRAGAPATSDPTDSTPIAAPAPGGTDTAGGREDPSRTTPR